MERLTFTDLELEVNGCDCVVRDVDETFDNFCEKVCEEFQYDCPFDKLGRKLKAYEDTGLTPEQIIAMDEEYEKLARRLGEYKRLEEQGRLIKLPCKIGDAVYVAETDKNMIHPFVVKNIHINKFEILFGLSYAGKEKRLQYWELRVEILRFGKLVFLTKAEAEKALEEMEK